MQKNKLNLHICGIYLLNPYKTVVSQLKANLQNRLLEVLMEEDDYVGIPFLIKKFQKKFQNNYSN